jgi:hypothetical protein
MKNINLTNDFIKIRKNIDGGMLTQKEKKKSPLLSSIFFFPKAFVL